MTSSYRLHLAIITASAAIAMGCMASATFAADAPKAKSSTPAKAAKSSKPSTKAAKKPPVVALPAADAEQLDAAKLVYYGHYECELKQIVDITEDAKDAGYVDVKHGKALYVMKPVLSSTGALRLEDVKGQTLMVQIANKSMLLDVKAGHRLVDECVSPKQRELMEAAAQAKEVAAAASAASAAASAATPATPATPASAPGQDVNGAMPYPPASAPVK